MCQATERGFIILKTKLITLANAKEQIDMLKKAGKKIIFTNGCFDILHAGHVTYLAQAKALGDILIIGLNSDHSVKQIKGKSRPIIPESERAIVLTALEAVDFIILFDDETPISLIQTLQPDIQVKGGDYIAENMPEYETISSYGGKIEILPFVKGWSSTTIIQKLSQK